MLIQTYKVLRLLGRHSTNVWAAALTNVCKRGLKLKFSVDLKRLKKPRRYKASFETSLNIFAVSHVLHLIEPGHPEYITQNKNTWQYWVFLDICPLWASDSCFRAR